MITTSDVTLSFGQRTLFEGVDIRFTPGNCYGLIGANGAGKSTFLKILSGEVEPSRGKVSMPENLRMSVLRQDHFAFNDHDALTTVLMGFPRLYAIMQEKDALYAKADFSEEDGIRAGNLEEEFTNLGGWEAEAQAGTLLCGLGLPVPEHQKKVAELDDSQRVRVLLAQALFGDPDVLLLDEPTNHLDVDSILWLENFLADFKNTVIVVSHDRHFLNHVCTHIADIDFGKIQLYTGNYDFWQQASDLALQQKRDQNKKAEDKAKELKEFIARFSANASKSKQATARKKLLDKLDFQSIQPSNRKYPHIVFDPEKLHSKELLSVQGVSKTIDGVKVLDNVSFTVQRDERVVFVSADSQKTTTMLEILGGSMQPDKGTVKWGGSVKYSYFPKDHGSYFQSDMDLIDWLRRFSVDQSEAFVRTFLGRMLFNGEESKKSVTVLSGGEKVRCMLAKLMLENGHALVLDGPTNHLDLESITALNRSLTGFQGALLFASHDVEFIRTLADRVIELKDGDIVDRHIAYSDYLEERAELIAARTAA